MKAGDGADGTPAVIAPEEFAQRREKVRARMLEEGLDALIAYSTAKVQANVRYLADYAVQLAGMQSLPGGGYHMFGSAALLLTADGEAVVRTDQSWDVARAREVSLVPDTGYAASFAEDFGPIIRSRGCRRVGIDSWYPFPAREYLALRSSAPATDLVATHLLSELRRIKSEAEIELMRRAAALADRAVGTALNAVKPGTNEYEVVLLCEQIMREEGDIELGGGSIAGCGAGTSTGSSIPARNENRAIGVGEWMMLDVCPRVGGYCGDISRHRLAGDMSDLDPRLRRLFDVALLINEEVRGAVRPGVSGRRLNDLATDIAREEGVLEHKIELLGHGIGLDVVDIPSFHLDESPLSPGEIITVEPCLLLTGVGGVRIEDMVLVTETGSETLTRLDRGMTAT